MVSVLSVSAIASEIQTVALSSGQPAGVESGAEYLSFVKPVLNNAGEVAFQAQMQLGLGGVIYADASGVWAGSPDQLRLVARSGQYAPGTPQGTNFRNMQSVLINDSGVVAFEGWLGPRFLPPRIVGDTTASGQSTALDTSNDFGIWVENAGTLRLVLREGNEVTVGNSNFAFLNFGSTFENASNDSGPHLVLSNAGQVAFVAEMASGDPTAPCRSAIVVGDANSIALPAIEGAGAPGLNGEIFNNLSFTPVINQSGDIAFGAGLSSAPGISDGGILTIKRGMLELVTRNRDLIADPIGGAAFIPYSLRTPVMNRGGDVAFLARGSDLLSAICAERNGILQVIAREGSTSGKPLGVAMFQKLGPPVINDAGTVAFRASSLNGAEAWAAPNDSGIWLFTSDGLKLFVREGDQAPGTSEGTVFDDFIIAGSYGNGYLTRNNWVDPIVNARGQVAFLASLRGVSDDSPGTIGLWASDPRGELQLIAREGDLMEATPGDFRMIDQLEAFTSIPGYAGYGSGIGRTGNSDGRPSIFNDRGQIVFSATFTDGSSGIFISNVAAVPEPSTIALMVICICLRMVHRGRIGDQNTHTQDWIGWTPAA